MSLVGLFLCLLGLEYRLEVPPSLARQPSLQSECLPLVVLLLPHRPGRLLAAVAGLLPARLVCGLHYNRLTTAGLGCQSGIGRHLLGRG